MPEQFLVLGIETSCDETAAAVVADGTTVVSSVVSSQVDIHARYGGVVPEIASRAHVELLVPVVAQALVEAGVEGPDLGAVAVSVGPGLAGALLVGISAAKAYAMAWDRPFIGVNHMEGHLYASFLEDPDLAPPLVVLLVSGGHTMLVAMDDHGSYRLLGTTVDDAVGEAFDKVARVMGLGYPGGPAIDRVALTGDPTAIAFPRPMPQGFDFSLSGLKTAVIRYVRDHPETPVADIAASFQAAAVDMLVDKSRRAVAEVGARSLCIGGGVAANSLLRQRILDLCTAEGLRCFLPSRSMCTDNAAMIAAAAWWRYRADGPTRLDVGAQPNLRLADPAGGRLPSPAGRGIVSTQHTRVLTRHSQSRIPQIPNPQIPNPPNAVEVDPSMNLRPLDDRIVVRPNEAEQTTSSGIVIPDTAKEKPQQGEVLAVGGGRRSEQTGEVIPLDVKVGDTVVYSKYGGTEITVDGEDVLILSSRDVLAVTDSK